VASDASSRASERSRRERARRDGRRRGLHRPSLALGMGLGVVVTLLASALPSPVTVVAGDQDEHDPSPPTTTVADARPGHPITVNWVGDTVLGSQYGLPANGAMDLFADTAPMLRDADLTIGNLEGTFSVGGASKCGAPPQGACFAFQAPPANAAALRAAGFDVMNLANNHAFDFGPDGQRQTITALDRAHIRHAGRPGAVTMLDVEGSRVAIIGFAPYPWATSLNDIPAARSLVTRAAHMADFVIAIMHAGAEGADQTHTPTGNEFAYGEDRGYTRGFAHAVIDGGADLVLGSGPHVIRGLEAYRGRLIAYSLGNFAGVHNFAMGGVLDLSAILHVALDGSGTLSGGRWRSVKLVGSGTPTIDRTNTSARLVAQLSDDDFGRDAVRVAGDGSLSIGAGP
jgi:hypothetical protein